MYLKSTKHMTWLHSLNDNFGRLPDIALVAGDKGRGSCRIYRATLWRYPGQG